MATTCYVPGDTQAEVVTALTNAQTCTDSITAAGGTQAAATALTFPGRFFRVSAGSGGVALPSLTTALANNGTAGANTPWCVIRNDLGTTLTVYGNATSADKVNGVVTTTGFAVGAGKSALFFANVVSAAGNWATLLSA